jgi:hypothetical protein
VFELDHLRPLFCGRREIESFSGFVTYGHGSANVLVAPYFTPAVYDINDSGHSLDCHEVRGWRFCHSNQLKTL